MICLLIWSKSLSPTHKKKYFKFYYFSVGILPPTIVFSRGLELSLLTNIVNTGHLIWFQSKARTYLPLTTGLHVHYVTACTLHLSWLCISLEIKTMRARHACQHMTGGGAVSCNLNSIFISVSAGRGTTLSQEQVQFPCWLSVFLPWFLYLRCVRVEIHDEEIQFLVRNE